MNATFYRKSTKNLHESRCTHFFEIFSPQMLLKMWNSESPWKTTKKKVLSESIFDCRKASKLLTKGVKCVYCSVAYLWDFRPVPRTRMRFVPRFAIPTFRSCPNQKCFPWQKKKMLEKNFFFVGEAPPSMLWNVPGTVLAACRQLPGVHAYIFFLPIFRFQRTSGFSCPFFGLRDVVANVGILRLFCHGRTESVNAERSLPYK